MGQKKRIIQKQKMQESMLEKAYILLHFLCHLCISIYMLLILVVMPFYNEEGYSHIGTDKYTFLKNSSLYMGYILLPVLGVYLIIWLIRLLKKKEKPLPEQVIVWFRLLSVTDIFAVCFALIVTVSYFSSDYREEALRGTNGWYMGLATQLTLVAVYFLISRLWKKTMWIPAMILPVSGIVFLLGYLNRFGIYPVEMASASPSFISTIGNINWYCGYMVTVFFGFLYLFWSGSISKKWHRAVLFGYSGIGFATMVTQGSSSGIMTLIVVFFLLFLMSAEDGKRMQAFLELVLLLSGMCLVTWGIRMCFPGAITYIEGTTDLFTMSPVPFIAAILSGGLWVLVKYKNEHHSYPIRVSMILKLVIIIAVSALACVFILMLAINTIRPGSIGPLSELGIFKFSPAWGSNRGATWTAGLMCFGEQNLWKKLVGVGPDCMAAYIYQNGGDKLLELVKSAFGTARLTNAHNEWITLLVNVGLLGVISYAGMMVSAIVRFLRKGSAIAGACGICILAYTVNNVVSFQQSMSVITVFVILGIGEAFARKCEKKF